MIQKHQLNQENVETEFLPNIFPQPYFYIPKGRQTTAGYHSSYTLQLHKSSFGQKTHLHYQQIILASSFESKDEQ